MRNKVTYISGSLTSSTKREMLLLSILDEHKRHRGYFIEYKTNLTPNPQDLHINGNTVRELNMFDFTTMVEAFNKCKEGKEKGLQYLHPPTFIYAFMLTYGIDLIELDILT